MVISSKLVGLFFSVFAKALLIRDAFRNNNLKATITPHSPYSVTPDLMKLIANVSDEFDYTFSMHNQETEEENVLFKNKKGKFLVLDLEIEGISLVSSHKAETMSILRKNKGDFNALLGTFTKSE